MASEQQIRDCLADLDVFFAESQERIHRAQELSDTKRKSEIIKEVQAGMIETARSKIPFKALFNS